MCGRAYFTITEDELEVRYISDQRKRRPKLDLKPNFNMAPTQTMPVVLEREGGRQIELFRWGLVPFWAKDVKSAAKYSLINARSEEIEEKRSYQQAFLKRRCIVPLSGFFEWKRTEKTKRPFAIHMKDQPIMSVAGVWEHWKDPEGKDVVNSFSILTCAANTFMEKIHNRMPVILDPKDEAAWLDPENHEPDALKKFLKPCPSKWLAAYEISTAVNSPRNNRKEILDPV